MRSLSLFFLSSLSASFFSYLFHVVLARKVGGEVFAQFSVEWSYLALFFVSGAFINYFAALNPLSQARKRSSVFVLQVLALTGFAGYFYFDHRAWLNSALVLENLSQGLILGFCLARKDYLTCNLLNLLLSGSRVLAIWLLPAARLGVGEILLAVFLSFLLSHIFYFARTWGQKPVVAKSEKWNWRGPFTLALVAGVLPQVDILWTSRFSTADALIRISELSLVSKAVFFVQMIVAQWLLPRDTAHAEGWLKLGPRRQLLAFAAFLVTCIGLGFVAHFALPWILHWHEAVTVLDFIKISAIGAMASLTFMLVQVFCKLDRVALPVFVLCGLLGQALLQGVAQVSLESYMTFTILYYALALVVLLHGLRRAFRARAFANADKA